MVSFLTLTERSRVARTCRRLRAWAAVSPGAVPAPFPAVDSDAAALKLVATLGVRPPHLTLLGARVSDTSAAALLALVGDKLASLRAIECLHVGDATLRAVGSACAQSPLTLVCIDARPGDVRTRNGYNGKQVAMLSDDALIAFAKACANLENLTLRWCRGFSDVGLKAILVAARDRLRAVTLSWIKITNSTCEDLAKLALMSRLELSTCREVTDDGLGMLAASMLPLTHLTLVDVGASDVGVGKLLSATGGKLVALKLSDLDLVTGSALASAPELAHLTRLHLSHLKSLSEDAVVTFMRRAPATLRVLELAWLPTIGDATLRALSESPARNSLRSLSIDAVAPIDPATLAHVVRSCPWLTRMDVFSPLKPAMAGAAPGTAAATATATPASNTLPYPLLTDIRTIVHRVRADVHVVAAA